MSAAHAPIVVPMTVAESNITVPMTVAESNITVPMTVAINVAAADVPAYDGAYHVTPSDEAQTLETRGKRMTADVVIAPIPSDYGKITWNGAYLTVS